MVDWLHRERTGKNAQPLAYSQPNPRTSIPKSNLMANQNISHSAIDPDASRNLPDSSESHSEVDSYDSQAQQTKLDKMKAKPKTRSSN